jgi:hypothetical protein
VPPAQESDPYVASLNRLCNSQFNVQVPFVYSAILGMCSDSESVSEERYLVLVPVQGHCRGVRKEEVVRGDVRLRRRVTTGAVLAEGIGAAPRRLGSVVVAADGLNVGLVDGDPVLHPVPEVLEADFRKCSVVFSATHVGSNFQLDHDLNFVMARFVSGGLNVFFFDENEA